MKDMNEREPGSGSVEYLPDLRSLTIQELKDLIAEFHEPAYRAGQIYSWLHKKTVVRMDEMSNIPLALREKLALRTSLEVPEIRALQVSKIDGTRKYLFRYADGSFAESVWMSYHHGNTVCISSQVGCRMGCRFCASTLLGLTRNLTSGEMLSQIYEILRDTGARVSNVVVMGTGEPLDNYEQLVRFIRMISDENGQNISERSITVSTCGLVPEIRRLKNEHLMIHLALSLHAPNDALRRTLMPVAKRYTLKETMAALKDYYSEGRRRLTFEYSLIRDVNDGDAEADQLASLLKGCNCLVNLIPVNPVTETGFREAPRPRVLAFKKKLENHGIHVTIRREMGRDIDGACGQLRKRCTEME